ncbi:hypothetical protein Trydic_g2351 [Trypoxylus dichotomus]
MRVAFLFLPIFICAGVVLASRDHDADRHKGHDQNKRNEINSGVDVSDELLQSYNGQEGRHYDTRRLSISDIVGGMAMSKAIKNYISPLFGLLFRRSRGIPLPGDAYNGHNGFDNVGNLEDSNLRHITADHSDRSVYNSQEKFGQPESKVKTA